MPADRRLRLVRVTAAEFAGHGFAETSLNAIIKRCGMSKSSFYYLFDSKEQLFDFAVAELLAEMASAVHIPSPAHFADGDFWSRVEALFAALLEAAGRDEAYLNLGRMFYSAAPETARGAVSTLLLQVRDWVHDVLRVGRGRGAVRDDLPPSLQCDLTFGVLQIFDEWAVTHVDDHAGAQAQTLAAAQFATLKRLLAP
jgi:AcrR family transcriptional regulator